MGPFVFLDLETTGKDPSLDHIIEVACIKWENGKITDRFETLVNPHVPVSQEITLLTGISDDMVKNATPFVDVKKTVADFVSDYPIIGHNIPFDLAFLKSHHLELNNPSVDTVELARILLHKEASYALEVLMKKYKPASEKSHRAMADIKNTAVFFEFLLGKIMEIPNEAWSQLELVLSKTNWHGKEIFNDIKQNRPTVKPATPRSAVAKKTKKNPRINGETPEMQETRGESKTWPENIVSDFLKKDAPSGRSNSVASPRLGLGEKILLESRGSLPLEAFRGQPLIIAYSTRRTRDKIIGQAARCGITANELKEPDFYISPARLDKKLLADNFPDKETPFLLKIILWTHQTQTGDREELSLEREEYPQFDMLTDHEKTGVFWKKALKNALESEIKLIHHHGFARGLANEFIQGKNAAEAPGLIILEASRLEDSFTFALKKRYTAADLEPYFGEKSTILFGLIGIFHDAFSGDEFAGIKYNVVINEETRNSREWQRVMQTISNLAPCGKKEELLRVFSDENNRVKWVSHFAEEVSFSSAPILLSETFHRSAAPFQKILLHGEALSAGCNFKFSRELFELDSDWKDVTETPETPFGNLAVEIPRDFPEPNSEGYFKKCLKLFEELIQEKRGKILLLLSSKKTVEAMYAALLPKTNEKTRLVGLGPSGGIGKSIAIFLENPAGSVLLATNQILPYFQEVEDFIETIVFQKIPFDPPDDPLLSSRSRQFSNGFTEYSLPRAVSKFRELLIEFGKGASGSGNKPKKCWILDVRLLTRDYGRLFI